jgi:hypothetical protein
MVATISPVTPSTRPATRLPTRRVPLLWIGFVVASLLALDVLDQTVWAIAVPLTAAVLWLASTSWSRPPSSSRPGCCGRARPCRDRRAVRGGRRAVAAGLHGVHRRPVASAVPVLWRRHAAGGGRTGHLHGLAAPAAARLPRPWNPSAAGDLGAGRAVCRGAGGHHVLGLRSSGAGGLGAAAGVGADRWAVRGDLFPRLPPGPPAGKLRHRAGRGRRRRPVRAVPRRLRHGPRRAGVPVRPRGRLRGCLPAGRQRAGAVAAADPAGRWFSNLQAGDIQLPWASIAGFADVLGLMALVIWLAYRHSRALARGGKR